MVSQISSKQAFNAFRSIIYLLLFALVLYFIRQGDVLERFAQKKTNFARYSEPIKELPTIIIYVNQTQGLQLGVDYSLSVQAWSGGINSTTKPTILTTNGLYPVYAEESYEPFKIDFEKHLYGEAVFKITPVVDPEVQLELIGDIAVSYTFEDTSTLTSKEPLNLHLSTENNSIVGSSLIGKWKSYDGLRAIYQCKMGETSRLTYTANRFDYLDIQPCRQQPFNEILYHKISQKVKECRRPCRPDRGELWS